MKRPRRLPSDLEAQRLCVQAAEEAARRLEAESEASVRKSLAEADGGIYCPRCRDAAVIDLREGTRRILHTDTKQRVEAKGDVTTYYLDDLPPVEAVQCVRASGPGGALCRQIIPLSQEAMADGKHRRFNDPVLLCSAGHYTIARPATDRHCWVCKGAGVESSVEYRGPAPNLSAQAPAGKKHMAPVGPLEREALKLLEAAPWYVPVQKIPGGRSTIRRLRDRGYEIQSAREAGAEDAKGYRLRR